MKRLREFVESIVFAGMKPGGRQPQAQDRKWLGPLSGPLERWISGSAPKDPLYLTNRTAGQKIKYWSLIAIPCLCIVGLVALSLSKNFFDPPVAAPQKELSPAETARKVLPNIGGDITIDTNRDVEVMQIRIDHSGPVRLTGIVQNNTSHAIRLTDIVFNLTNKSGSQVGAVNCRIDNLAPKATQEFQIPLKQQDAAFALVREVSTSR